MYLMVAGGFDALGSRRLRYARKIYSYSNRSYWHQTFHLPNQAWRIEIWRWGTKHYIRKIYPYGAHTIRTHTHFPFLMCQCIVKCHVMTNYSFIPSYPVLGCAMKNLFITNVVCKQFSFFSFSFFVHSFLSSACMRVCVCLCAFLHLFNFDNISWRSQCKRTTEFSVLLSNFNGCNR